MHRPRIQWRRYELTVTTRHSGTYHTTHYDPAYAVECAAEAVRSPVLDNPFTDPAAISVLHLGMPLETTCADGTRITITPVIT